MKIKLNYSAKSCIEISRIRSVILIPKFYKPKFENVKKGYGDKWDTKKHVRWYVKLELYWLAWSFKIILYKRD